MGFRIGPFKEPLDKQLSPNVRAPLVIVNYCIGWYIHLQSISKAKNMSTKLPYLASPGTIKTVLDKIIEARTPDRFTYDFLETKLGAKGGSARAVIPLLKRIATASVSSNRLNS